METMIILVLAVIIAVAGFCKICSDIEEEKQKNAELRKRLNAYSDLRELDIRTIREGKFVEN